MRSLICLFITILCYLPAIADNYYTPGTGVNWNLDDLVTNSGGDVTFSNGEYFINDTVFISEFDTLYITSDAVVKFAANTYLDVNGTLLIDPPNNVTFTAQNTTSRYLGMRIDSSNTSVLRKLTFEYANSLRLFDCSPVIDSCIFQYNSTLTTFGNAAISVFRSNPLITNSHFLNNYRAAIQGGSNIANAPKIIGCLFMGNNTLNGNVPQINLGATGNGSDTVKILNNQILRASTNSGGIGFLPLGNVYAVVSGNIIRNNRYGITLNGGSNINSIISYNVIDSNNTQNNPALGGSGIAFSGGSATSHQNSIVTGNLIQANLWGITIQNGSKPNLGDLTNSDTADDGKNSFINNTNATTPGIDLYNNSPDDIMAQGNYWGTADPGLIEARIFHQPDNSALGLVNYSNYLLPIELVSFTATNSNSGVKLQWQVASQINSSHFVVERSNNSELFQQVGLVDAAGNSSESLSYDFTDPFRINSTVYYRLKLVDRDGQFKYSNIISLKAANVKEQQVKLYPTILSTSDPLIAEITSDQIQTVTIQVLNSGGKLIRQTMQTLLTGLNKVSIPVTTQLSYGVIYIRFIAKGINQTIPVLSYQK